jgi:mutator protein MutT
MKECTLLFLIHDGEILLAMKKRGFGSDRWNGVGGKIEAGETIEDALVRECQEEIVVTPKNFHKVALLDFKFADGVTDMRVHAYLCDDWEGEPVETDEMAPQWFRQAELPYKEMWDDDEYWLPHVLDGKLVRGTFVFNEQEKMLEHTMKFVEKSQITE